MPGGPYRASCTRSGRYTLRQVVVRSGALCPGTDLLHPPSPSHATDRSLLPHAAAVPASDDSAVRFRQRGPVSRLILTEFSTSGAWQCRAVAAPGRVAVRDPG